MAVVDSKTIHTSLCQERFLPGLFLYCKAEIFFMSITNNKYSESNLKCQDSRLIAYTLEIWIPMDFYVIGLFRRTFIPSVFFFLHTQMLKFSLTSADTGLSLTRRLVRFIWVRVFFFTLAAQHIGGVFTEGKHLRFLGNAVCKRGKRRQCSCTITDYNVRYFIIKAHTEDANV